MQNNGSLDLVKLVLPEGILEYFTLNNIDKSGEYLNIYIKEKNIPPQDYQKNKLPEFGLSSKF